MRRVIGIVALTLLGVVGMPESASAQIDLSKVGKLFGAMAAKPQRSPYEELVKSAPAKSEVVGTWHYDKFSVEYLGANSFAKGAIAQLESFATAELESTGIAEESYEIVLRNSGKGSLKYDDSAYDGNYTYDASSAQFQITVKEKNGTTIVCNGFLKMVDGTLVTMLKAEDVMNAVALVAPEVQMDDTFIVVRGIVDSFPGIYISLYHTK